MRPKIGDVVIFRQGDEDRYQGGNSAGHGTPHWRGGNGTREHPAVITRVWTNECVNLTVFFDAGDPEPRSSVVRVSSAPTEGVTSNGGWDFRRHGYAATGALAA